MPTPDSTRHHLKSFSELPAVSWSFASPESGSHHGPIARRAYKIHEAAEAIGVTPITIRRMIERGLMRPCRALRHVLIPVDEIEKLLNR